MMGTIVFKTPGRICLFGDHQDYLGLPVIAATIDRYISLHASPIDTPELFIVLDDLNQKMTIALDDPCENLAPRDYFRSALRVLRKEGIVLRKGYRIHLRGDIPINAGLSSSSAVVVAWVRFILKAAQPQRRFKKEQIAAWAHAAEVVEFNEPGGIMDHYTIALGGMIFLNTQTAEYLPLEPPNAHFVLGESGLEKATLSVLGQSKSKALKALEMVKEKTPDFDLLSSSIDDVDSYKSLLPKTLFPYWYAAIHNYEITKKALTLLQASPRDISQLGTLMNMHQAILDKQLNNTPPLMAKMMAKALKNGGLGAKIVGSGGGGCFLVLGRKKNAQALLSTFKDDQKVYTIHLTPEQNG